MPETTKHNEEVDEILSRPSGWMLRWGLSLLLGLLIVIFLISYFLRYPDAISAGITITSENPVVSVSAPVSGKVDTLFITDNACVNKGDILAVINNPADFEDVHLLDSCLDSLRLFFRNPDKYSLSDMSVELPNLRLGDLQRAFREFTTALSEYRELSASDGLHKKALAVQKEKLTLDKYLENYKKQNVLLTENLASERDNYLNDSILYSKNAISKAEWHLSKSFYHHKKYAFQESRFRLSQIEMQLAAFEKENMNLQLDLDKVHSDHLARLNIAYEDLADQIHAWELKYVIKSTASGRAVIFDAIQNRVVKQGDELFIISPERSGKISGLIKLMIHESSKVRIGQSVIIKLADYPPEEYGQLTGTVTRISMLPKDSAYWIRVHLDDGLITTAKHIIPFKNEIRGVAEIITETRSVLDRFLGKLSPALHSH
jgi:multidrug resistance efflux pump